MPSCFSCSICFASISALHTHFKAHHNLQANEEYGFRCAEGDGCFSTYSGWKAYRVHLLKRHKCPQLAELPTLQCDKVSELNFQPLPSNEPPSEIDVDLDPAATHNSPLDLPRIFEDMVIEFAAKLYANHKLPRSHVVDIMEATSDLLGSMVDLLKSEVIDTITGCEKDKACSKVEKQLESLVKPFANLSSEYKYIKALKSRDYFISLHTYSIGARVAVKRKQGIMKRVLSNVTAKFIPMRVVLQKIFSLPGVYAAVSSYVSDLTAKEGWLENFVQGNLWRSKVENHFQGKTVFPVFLYFDDFEINNPLGSHAGIHKLGGVYYSIPCFPPEVQSLLENIFVAALFHSCDRVDFANHSTFSEIVKELNFLQSEGIIIDSKDGPRKIYFSLGLVLGDNLGLNQILGFQEGFNANYSCRFCKTSKFQRQWETSENHFRTRESYIADIVESDPKNTGVKELSVFDGVKHFETFSNFAVDFLHDGPEGAFKKFMGLILHYFAFVLKTTKSRFLKILNDRLQCFDCYNNAISNRPPLISFDEAKEKQVKMSASEMQIFTIIFPMLVGDIVPLDDEVWIFYLTMRKVLDIALAPRLTTGHVPLLKTYVGEMYEMFLSVFPEESVPPKLHIWVHYYRVLAESGPITHLSTFRFESKHRHKKTEASATTSRVDITGTLCHKELHCLAYRFILGKGFAPNNKFGKRVKALKVSELNGYFSFKSSCPKSFLDKSCFKLNFVTVNGQTYRKGSCVVLRLEGIGEVYPTFGIVDHVLQNANKYIILICKTLLTVGFEHDYHAYEVQSSNDYECISVAELITPSHAIHVTLSENSYVTLRHGL